MGLPEATAAALQQKIGGKTVGFAPLDIDAWGELNQFGRALILDLGRRVMQQTRIPEPLNGDATDEAVTARDAEIVVAREERDYIWDKAFDRAEAFTLASPSFEKVLSSPDVLPTVVWLSMRIRNPAATLADAVAVCNEVDDATQLMKDIMRISQGKSKGKGGSETENPPKKPTETSG